jgi:Tfp pilus assembly protein PilO
MNEKSMIFILFMIVLIGMGSEFYFNNYKAYLDEKVQLDADIAKIQDEINKAKNLDQDIANAKKQLAEDNKKIVALSKKIHTTINIPVILNKIEEYAKATKVEFKEIKFDNISEFESYSVLPIKIQVIGEYHCLGRFMSRLENFNLITARKGKLTLATSGSSGSSGYQQFSGYGYQGVGVRKRKTMITMSFDFNVYKFAALDYSGSEDLL